jgi:hypothetical protein
MVAIEEVEEVQVPHQAQHEALLLAHGGDAFALLGATFAFLQNTHPAAFSADKVLDVLKGTSSCVRLSHRLAPIPVVAVVRELIERWRPQCAGESKLVSRCTVTATWHVRHSVT